MPCILLVLYLQISVHNPQLVQVVDGVQHLSNQVTGIPLCVVPLRNDPVKQLPPGYPAYDVRAWEDGE